MEVLTKDCIIEIFKRTHYFDIFAFIDAYPEDKNLINSSVLWKEKSIKDFSICIETKEEYFMLMVQTIILKANKHYRTSENADDALKVLIFTYETLCKNAEIVSFDNKIILRIQEKNKYSFAWWPFLSPKDNFLSYLFFPNEINELNDSAVSLYCRGEIVCALIFSAKFSNPLAIYWCLEAIEYHKSDYCHESDNSKQLNFFDKVKLNLNHIVDLIVISVENNLRISTWAINILFNNFEIADALSPIKSKLFDMGKNDFRYLSTVVHAENDDVAQFILKIILQNDKDASCKTLYLELLYYCHESRYSILKNLVNSANDAWKKELEEIVLSATPPYEQLAYDLSFKAGTFGIPLGYFRCMDMAMDSTYRKTNKLSVDDINKLFFELSNKAGNSGMIEAYERIGDMYRWKDVTKAKKLYLKAAWSGNRYAFREAGDLTTNEKEKANYYKRSKNFNFEILADYSLLTWNMPILYF
jgi:hypothetical protein